MEKTLEDRCDMLFNNLVPDEGKADTVEGEMIRAISRIGYRWSNDGDYFYKGYGAETAGPAHEYLITLTPIKQELYALYAKAIGKKEDDYEAAIDAAAKMIIEYVESRKGKTTPNSVDLLDCISRFYREEKDDEDYDYELD